MTEMTAQTKANRKENSAVRRIAIIGVLSACAFVLQYIELPAILMPSFVKFDFSDLPALLGAFALGPVSGIIIELIKNLFHCLVSQSFGVGELCNFVLGAVFAGVAGLIYKKNHTRKGALIASFAGAIAMAVVSVPFNYFIVYPVYYNFMPADVILSMYQAILPGVKSIAQSLLVFNMPFTFIKGMIDVVITFLIYKKLSPVLHA